MRDPALIVALANAQAGRRPTGARSREPHDGLASATSATDLLAPFLGRPVRRQELPALRQLQRAVTAVVDALLNGSPAPLEALNRLAAGYRPARALEQRADGTLHVTLRFERTSAATILIHQALSELEGVDPRRLRRCGRPECNLVFYDLTRSATQRWHSERPCGLRERQRRHRARYTAEPSRGMHR